MLLLLLFKYGFLFDWNTENYHETSAPSYGFVHNYVVADCLLCSRWMVDGGLLGRYLHVYYATGEVLHPLIGTDLGMSAQLTYLQMAARSL